MDIWDTEHEQVAFHQDAATGLRAIVAVHSTALGPALGGTRFHPYPSEAAALADALDLSRAMTYKNALAGLDHGGGKAVIIGDPARDKTAPLLLAYGRFVQGLAGRYVTASDVGTYVADMDVVARECDFVTGRSERDGGAGDSSALTALGVFQGLRAAAAHRWGTPALAGRRVGVAGVGKVGHQLVDLVRADGADVVVTDVSDVALDRVRRDHPDVQVVASTADLVALELDVYSPCALGGAITTAVAESLTAGVVCGAANNQLATPEAATVLHRRGITYAPDFVVNCGGVIQVADELHGFSFDRARARTLAVFDTTAAVLRRAAEDDEPPSRAAERLAEQRIAAATGPWRPASRPAR